MDYIRAIDAFLKQNGIDFLYSFIILVIGIYAARKTKKIAKRFFTKTKMEPSLIGFFSQLIYVLMIIFVAVIVLEKMGLKTTSFITVLGAAGLAIGLALQGSLSNFAAGVLILIFKPFAVGDYIEGSGAKGTVYEIQLLSTVLKAFGNESIIVPNSKLINENVINYSKAKKRRLEIKVGISYQSDIKNTREVLLGIASSDSRVDLEPQPEVVIADFSPAAINMSLRVWTDNEHYWDVYFSAMEHIREEFEKKGIELPVAQNLAYFNKQA